MSEMTGDTDLRAAAQAAMDLARIIRDSLDPSFKDAPPPAWAEAAAAEIIAYHQPMLRDTILDAHLAAERARLAALVEALPTWDKRSVPGGIHVNRAAVLALLEPDR